jgi:glycosyltransferase involved in cell wall biosynthesis
VVRRLSFAIPGDLATRTGGYAYDRRIIAELRALGWQVDVIGLGDGFPQPAPDQKRHAQAQLAATPADAPVVIDGLAFGVLPEAAAVLKNSRRLVALVHHPLAYETGLTAGQATALHASETAALSAARAVIATSAPTARNLVADFAVPQSSITVAPPGTDRGALSRGGDGPVQLVSVGAIVPRKGFDVLVEALAKLGDLPWRLDIAGDRGRDPDAAARLDAAIAAHGLGGRIAVLGAVPNERLFALYESADLFVLASHFEGYGMAYAEALAHGLPVIGTTGGAIPETVPADAGVLVPPGDIDALAQALRDLIEDGGARQRLAAAARVAASRLPTWQETARTFAAAVEAVA